MSAGISSIATYVPVGRLSSKALRLARAGGAPAGVRTVAVADVDEDVVTMGAEVAELALAAIDCSLDEVGLLYLATCSAPYGEHSPAAELARALDLPRHVPTIDVAGSVRAAVPALRAAADAVESGRVDVAVVVAADRRRGRIGTPLEALGAGAAAVVVTREGARIGKLTSHRHGVPTRWRPEGARELRGYDDARYERDGQILPALAAVLADGAGAFLAYGHPDARSGNALAASLGAKDIAMGDAEVAEIGDLGTAAPLFALAACLAANPKGAGHVVAAEPGSGADCLVVDPQGATVALRHRRPATVELTYVDFLRAYGELLPPGPPEPIVPWAATPGAERDDRAGTLSGARCAACSSLTVPAAPRCVDCGGRELTPARVPRTGRVVTHNLQHVVAVHPESAPVAVGVARLDGEGGTRGGQVSAMFCGPGVDRLEIGTPVELVYRRIGLDDGLVKYGWKLRPVVVDDAR